MGTAEVSVQKLGREWSCALSALKEIDPQGSLKLSELSDLVARFGPSEDDPARCNLPTIDKYPTAQRLEAMVSLAIHLIQREYVEALDPEKLRDGLDAIWMLYMLHFQRTMAAIREPNFDRADELNPFPSVIAEAPEGYIPPDAVKRHLVTEKSILHQIKSIDKVVVPIYDVLKGPRGPTIDATGGPVVAHVVEFVFRIWTLLKHQRRANALREDDLCLSMRRRASTAYLCIAHVALQRVSRVHMHLDALSTIRKSVIPRQGIWVQGMLFVSLYGLRVLDRSAISDLSQAMKWAGQPPPYIWEEFSKICAQCFQPARLGCHNCRQVQYCDAECQKAHWKAQHKTMCNIYKHGLLIAPPAASSNAA